jgi:hypothetical protein
MSETSLIVCEDASVGELSEQSKVVVVSSDMLVEAGGERRTNEELAGWKGRG